MTSTDLKNIMVIEYPDYVAPWQLFVEPEPEPETEKEPS